MPHPAEKPRKAKELPTTNLAAKRPAPPNWLRNRRDRTAAKAKRPEAAPGA
jgi:hypothetical protein